MEATAVNQARNDGDLARKVVIEVLTSSQVMDII